MVKTKAMEPAFGCPWMGQLELLQSTPLRAMTWLVVGYILGYPTQYLHS